MSHYVIAVVVPKEKQVDEERIKKYIDRKMAPYSENLEVEPYIDIPKVKGIGEFIRVKKKYPTYEKNTYEEFVNAWYNQEVDDKGNILSTYNPKSRWDWFRIGGRWDGNYTFNKDNVTPDDKGGFNFEKRFEELSNNSVTVKEFIKNYKAKKYEYMFSTLLDSKGQWNQNGKMGWWGITHSEDMSDKKFDEVLLELMKSEKPDSLLVFLDCHI